MDVSYAELYFEGEGVYAHSIVTDGDRTVAVYERLQDGAANPDAVEVGNNDLHKFYIVHLGAREHILSDGWWRDEVWLPPSGRIVTCDKETPTIIWWEGQGFYARHERGHYSKSGSNRATVMVTADNLIFMDIVAFSDRRGSFAFVPSHHAKAFMRAHRISKNTGKFLDGALAAH